MRISIMVTDLPKYKKDLCLQCNKYYPKNGRILCSYCYKLKTFIYKCVCYCGCTTYSNEFIYGCNSDICREMYYEHSGVYVLKLYELHKDYEDNGKEYWKHIGTY